MMSMSHVDPISHESVPNRMPKRPIWCYLHSDDHTPQRSTATDHTVHEHVLSTHCAQSGEPTKCLVDVSYLSTRPRTNPQNGKTSVVACALAVSLRPRGTPGALSSPHSRPRVRGPAPRRARAETPIIQSAECFAARPRSRARILRGAYALSRTREPIATPRHM